MKRNEIPWMGPQGNLVQRQSLKYVIFINKEKEKINKKKLYILHITYMSNLIFQTCWKNK